MGGAKKVWKGKSISRQGPGAQRLATWKFTHFFAAFAGFAALRETAGILRCAQNDNVQAFFRSLLVFGPCLGRGLLRRALNT